jgi:Flp pilus assembly protein TadG
MDILTKTPSPRKSRFSCFLRECTGNFGITTALVLPVVAATAGVALDLNSMLQMRTALQSATDAAVFSAVNAVAADPKMTDEAVLAFARQFMSSQFESIVAETKSGGSIPVEAAGSVTRTPNGSETSYDVTLSPTYTMPTNGMTSLLGWKQVTIGITSTATSASETKALSMYLVLDRSGSMSFPTDTVDTSVSQCVNYYAWNLAQADIPQGQPYALAPSSPCYVRKMAALKKATNELFKTLSESDPKGDLTRVGAVAYNHTTEAPSGMAWGIKTAKKYVTDLPSVPRGGTDASDGMALALAALTETNSTERKAHHSKKSESFDRYIVLMTDGAMTGNSSDWNHAVDSKVRQLCQMAKVDGITIFSIAFMAPEQGKSLLKACASSEADNYFEPSDMSGLVNAFRKIGHTAAQSGARLTN